MFRFAAPPPFFLLFKKKVERFPKLRGFQKSANCVQRWAVFTLKVERLSSDVKVCSYTKLRGSPKLRGIQISEGWNGVQKSAVLTTKVQRFSSDAKMCSHKELRGSPKLNGIQKKSKQCQKIRNIRNKSSETFFRC